MKFSGKIWFMIKLKATKNQDFIVSLKKHFFGKLTPAFGNENSVNNKEREWTTK